MHVLVPCERPTECFSEAQRWLSASQLPAAPALRLERYIANIGSDGLANNRIIEDGRLKKDEQP